MQSPVIGAVGKGVKAFKGTNELADLAKLLKIQEEILVSIQIWVKMWYNSCVIIKLICLTV